MRKLVWSIVFGSFMKILGRRIVEVWSNESVLYDRTRVEARAAGRARPGGVRWKKIAIANLACDGNSNGLCPSWVEISERGPHRDLSFI